MITFFNTFITPNSLARAKLSVHMLAQQKQLATTLAAAEQRTKLFQMLEQFLYTQDVTVDSDALRKRLENIDIGSGEVDPFVQALEAYLIQDASVARNNAQAIVDQASLLVPTALAGVGVRANTQHDAMTNGVGGHDGFTNGNAQKKAALKIEDVHGWKAGLQVSAGPRPVRGLEEFEDLEAKL